jgi:hypothetical protein
MIGCKQILSLRLEQVSVEPYKAIQMPCDDLDHPLLLINAIQAQIELISGHTFSKDDEWVILKTGADAHFVTIVPNDNSLSQTKEWEWIGLTASINVYVGLMLHIPELEKDIQKLKHFQRSHFEQNSQVA